MNGKMRCPDCGNECIVMATAYGARAICTICEVRWTHLRPRPGQKNDSSWYPEKWTGLRSNR